MDAVPIEPVIEVRTDCSDRARVTAALNEALAVARGPRRSTRPDAAWRVTVRVTSGAKNARSADAQIVDDDGRVVAERTVADKSGGSCLALARAVGAWAQIVLDDELQRAKDEAEKPIDDAQAKGTSTTTLAAQVPDPKTVQDHASSEPTPSSSSGPTPIEVGSMLFLRNGATENSGMFGVSPFVVYGISGRWLLRPALAAGTSTRTVVVGQDSTNLTYLGGRLDFCRRVPGNYIERRGLELDACAGIDGGALTTFERTVARLSAGPAVTLRGELAENIALEIRGTAGVNLARNTVAKEQPPAWFVGGAEVGASVRFR